MLVLQFYEMKENRVGDKPRKEIKSWVKTLLIGAAGVVGGFVGMLCGVYIWYPVWQLDWGIFSGVASIFTGMFVGGLAAMKAGDIIGRWLDG
jgi:hypothetical protein